MSAKTSAEDLKLLARHSFAIVTKIANRNVKGRHYSQPGDVVGEFFAKAFGSLVRRFDHSKSDAGWVPWLACSFRNFIRDHFRRSENHPTCNFTSRGGSQMQAISCNHATTIGSNDHLTIGDLLPDARRDRAKERRDFAELIKSLAPHYRRVLTAYYVDGLSMIEIGEQYGLSANRVSQLHAEAKSELRAAAA